MSLWRWRTISPLRVWWCLCAVYSPAVVASCASGSAMNLEILASGRTNCQSHWLQRSKQEEISHRKTATKKTWCKMRWWWQHNTFLFSNRPKTAQLFLTWDVLGACDVNFNHFSHCDSGDPIGHQLWDPDPARLQLPCGQVGHFGSPATVVELRTSRNA